MTNTYKHAETELNILVAEYPEEGNRPIIEPFIPEILALCEKFGNSGQSGGSAPYTAQALSQAVKTLCLQQPLCPITGRDEEWMDVSEDAGEYLFQNKRCSALFKRGKSGISYYLDAITFKTQKDIGWLGVAKIRGTDKKVWSRQYVRSFPFEPKTFVIDVIEEEVAKDNWDFYIKDPAQLEEVFKYYNEYGKTS